MLSERISSERFETLVEEALESIPATLWAEIDNVGVVVEEWPTRQQMQAVKLRPGNLLLGLYQGVPLTARTRGYNLTLPDKITIFRGPILQVCQTRLRGRYPEQEEAVVRAQVKRTVLHEIAHHFGISDQRLHQLGAY